MTSRPGEWDLLGYDGDPCSGDPTTVRSEGTHYNGVADTINEQIRRLRQLAEPDEALKGAYTDGLQKSCEDLAENLGKIEGRFRETGRQLSGFAGDLTTARVTTGIALDEAVDAKRRMDANAPQDTGGADLSAAQQQAAEDRAGRAETASGDLAAARTKARRAMETFDGEAGKVAKAIRDASDDDMKDSRWDKFKDAVGNVSDVLNKIADVLGYIGAALAIVAIFIPGLNVLVIAAFLVGALALHTLLAATGNGSWLDVAFDVVGLLTLGAGSIAVRAAQVGRAATLANAGRVAGRGAAQTTLARASFNGGRGVIGSVHKFVLRNFSTTVRTNMRVAYDDAFNAVANRALPNASVAQSLRAMGDRGLAQLVKDHRLLIQEFGTEVIDPRYTANLTRALAFTAGNQATNLPILLNPKFGDNELWNTPGYGDLQDRMTWTPGGPF